MKGWKERKAGDGREEKKIPPAKDGGGGHKHQHGLEAFQNSRGRTSPGQVLVRRKGRKEGEEGCKERREDKEGRKEGRREERKEEGEEGGRRGRREDKEVREGEEGREGRGQHDWLMMRKRRGAMRLVYKAHRL
jgi:hypothetical protein